MRPQYERVEFPPGCSVRVFHRQLDDLPFEWHYHPEYELTLTRNSRGERYIGDHIARYDQDDLVLVPPNLPHTWASSVAIEPARPHEAVVLWFSRDWVEALARVCPEMSPVRGLLHRAGRALAFEPAAADARTALLRLPDTDPMRRLTGAMSLLRGLAEAPARPLTSPGAAVEAPAAADQARLAAVLDHVHAHYTERIRIGELARIANLSGRSLHRFFQRYLGQSVTRYLTDLRVGQACSLLAGTSLPVGVIAQRAGYGNLSNFNRQFRQRKGMTPRAFRTFHDRHGVFPRVKETPAPNPEATPAGALGPMDSFHDRFM